jgi:predicted nucleic acid-binding protein
VNYVLDSSALIQAYISDPHSARMQTVIKMAYDRDHSLHILDFGRSECLNIIWKRVVFHGLSVDIAKRSLRSLSLSPLLVHSPVPYYNRTLDIGIQFRLPAYDSLYLALAEALAFPLISDDQRQMEVAKNLGLKLKPIVDFVPYKP